MSLHLDRLGRLTEVRRPSGRVAWNRSSAQRPAPRAQGTTTELYLYDEIGWYGVTAADFAAQLSAVTTPSVTLHVNSPGGDVYDGIAMYNALIDHPAHVTAKVDGLAASAASFIVQGADRIVMGRNSELMIHDALGLTVGNEAAHRSMADLLSDASDNLASIYAGRAGGTPKDWRKAMRAETWYSADEAVAAGLADEVLATPLRRGDAAPEEGDDLGEELAAALADLGPSLRSGLAQAIEDRRHWSQVERLATKTTGDGLAAAIAEGLAS